MPTALAVGESMTFCVSTGTPLEAVAETMATRRLGSAIIVEMPW